MNALESPAACSIAGGSAAARPAERQSGLPVPPPPVEFRYTQSESFVALLHELRASLLVRGQ